MGSLFFDHHLWSIFLNNLLILHNTIRWRHRHKIDASNDASSASSLSLIVSSSSLTATAVTDAMSESVPLFLLLWILRRQFLSIWIKEYFGSDEIWTFDLPLQDHGRCPAKLHLLMLCTMKVQQLVRPWPKLLLLNINLIYDKILFNKILHNF